jgi:pimeloyl-ACP methyl ester carboxylesterase
MMVGQLRNLKREHAMSVKTYKHGYVEVLGVRTHYLEAGSGPDLVLLHSGEYGASAELSWRYNIAGLSEHFHILAPDLPGWGDSDKVYSFSERTGFRIRHVAEFCRIMSIGSGYFIGSSFSGGLLLNAAGHPKCELPITKLITVGGGGDLARDPTAREVLTSYDGTPEHMRRALQALFFDEKWWTDELVAEKQESALKPGAWEAISAARLRRPGDKFVTQFPDSAPGNIKIPTLIVAGEDDQIKDTDWGERLKAQIPGSQLYTFRKAGHMSHIEHPDEFNKLAVSFLLGQG